VKLVRTFIGFVLLILGALAALPLPEVGIPLVLIGLRILGRHYRWARTANAWLDERWARTRAAFHRLPLLGQIIVGGVLLAVAVALGWLAVSHL
jgi:hypothetical protein